MRKSCKELNNNNNNNNINNNNKNNNNNNNNKNKDRVNLQSGNDCKRKTLADVNNQRGIFHITICNGDDASQAYAQEMHGRIQIQ